MPPKPRWLLSLPDAVKSVRASRREFFTRRDIQDLFGLRPARAKTLFAELGAVDRIGQTAVMRRERLAAALEARLEDGDYAVEKTRRELFMSRMHRARVTGVRIRVPIETAGIRLAGLPEGVRVTNRSISIDVNGSRDAFEKLTALAYAVTNDYPRFEALWGSGTEADDDEQS